MFFILVNIEKYRCRGVRKKCVENLGNMFSYSNCSAKCIMIVRMILLFDIGYLERPIYVYYIIYIYYINGRKKKVWFIKR